MVPPMASLFRLRTHAAWTHLRGSGFASPTEEAAASRDALNLHVRLAPRFSNGSLLAGRGFPGT